jgi:hypothetical protein
MINLTGLKDGLEQTPNWYGKLGFGKGNEELKLITLN